VLAGAVVVAGFAALGPFDGGHLLPAGPQAKAVTPTDRSPPVAAIPPPAKPVAAARGPTAALPAQPATTLRSGLAIPRPPVAPPSLAAFPPAPALGTPLANAASADDANASPPAGGAGMPLLPPTAGGVIPPASPPAPAPATPLAADASDAHANTSPSADTPGTPLPAAADAIPPARAALSLETELLDLPATATGNTAAPVAPGPPQSVKSPGAGGHG
jgi:hypothetical protein